MVYLTDLPRRHGVDPLLPELRTQNRSVLECLPAPGVSPGSAVL